MKVFMLAALLWLSANTASAEPLSNVGVDRFVWLRGQVVQSVQSGPDFWLRVNVTRAEYGIWKDTIIVSYHTASPLQLQYPIREKTIVEFAGWHRGKTSYQTVLGANLELPLVEACVLWDAEDSFRPVTPAGCHFE